jgi:hypothetical protein
MASDAPETTLTVDVDVQVPPAIVAAIAFRLGRWNPSGGDGAEVTAVDVEGLARDYVELRPRFLVGETETELTEFLRVAGVGVGSTPAGYRLDAATDSIQTPD